MQVTVVYAAQVKRAAGVASENVDVDATCSVQDLLTQVAAARGNALKNILFDDDGVLHPSILLFVRDSQIRWETPFELNDRDVVTVLSPISGG
ncbi:MAG: MoaD/ThiS family protein [Planctomycetes bacterium]|nr:MoaD/ThiS family protein [Planctomycetota bacterium]